MSQPSADSLVTHTGSCACGAVAFEFDAIANITVQACNCSICEMTEFQRLLVPASRVRLLTDEKALTTYTCNTGVAHLMQI
jgi:hypothetical protein